MMLTTGAVCAANTQHESPAPEPQLKEKVGEDFAIIKDETKDGIRYVTAVGGRACLVCTQKMDIQLKGNVIQSVVFTGGCPGNLIAVGRLIKGKKVQDVISLLRGVDCGGRGTSCTDQLSRVLERL